MGKAAVYGSAGSMNPQSRFTSNSRTSKSGPLKSMSMRRALICGVCVQARYRPCLQTFLFTPKRQRDAVCGLSDLMKPTVWARRRSRRMHLGLRPGSDEQTFSTLVAPSRFDATENYINGDTQARGLTGHRMSTNYSVLLRDIYL